MKLAANGSGKVAFEFDNLPVTTLGDKNHNADDSIPAGITKDDVLDLIIRYTPDGDMDEGEFEVRLPSGWKAEEIITSGPINTTTKTGDPVHTVAVDFLSNFGVEKESIDITLVDVTVPNKHGNNGFRSKSKSKGGSLKQLSPIPAAFVGNTMADNDTVKVEINPAEAYQNQENVDFEITVEANGPMHDSEIQITVPDGLSDLQDDSAKANYVRKVSAPVSGVDVILDNDVINITTGKLNPGGKIKVRFDNVNLKDISTDPDLGFRVGTRTRTDVVAGEEETAGDLSGVDFELIEKDDGTRSIVGGLIRTVAGSGTMAVEPATIEQGSRNKNIKLTFTATTDFEKLNLKITAPPVIDTELHEDKSSNDGYVSSPNAAKLHEDDTDDDLDVSGNVITWGKLTLNRGEKFVTNIKRVDLLEDTGDAQWEVELGDVDITAADTADSKANPPMVVVGTMEEDVVFEVVDESDIPNSNPSYHASSLQSIRFKFTTENTAIQAGGRLWFTIPVGWSLPSLTDKTGKATVSIVAKNGEAIVDADGDPIAVRQLPKAGDDNAGSQMVLSVSGRSVILSIGAKGGLAEGDSVTIRYGDSTDPMKFPVQISASAKGTTSDGDGLAIRGHFRVSDDFRQRDADTIWADVTNVVDGSGTAAISSSPATVRAGSTKNTVTVTFTGTGTMDGGALRFTIPEGWGAMQEDPLERNHIDVDVSGPNAALTDSEILDDGRQVVATLETFGKGNKVIFTYGGGDWSARKQRCYSPSRHR